jgi:hypothetical protein
LENRFRRIKGDAKALNDALEKGIDPITIPTDSLNGKIGGGKGRLQPKPDFLIVQISHSVHYHDPVHKIHRLSGS